MKYTRDGIAQSKCIKSLYLRVQLTNVTHSFRLDDVGMDPVDLASSSVSEGDFADNEEASRTPKIAVTIWSSITSTFTMTMTTTTDATKYSVSFYCSVAGAPFPAAC